MQREREKSQQAQKRLVRERQSFVTDRSSYDSVLLPIQAIVERLLSIFGGVETSREKQKKAKEQEGSNWPKKMLKKLKTCNGYIYIIKGRFRF